MTADEIAAASERLAEADAQDICAWALETFGEQAAFAFSGAEDVVVIDLLARTGLPFSVFTLETHRLHDETYDLLRRVEDNYDLQIELVRPRAQEVDALVARGGYDGMFGSIEARKDCCRVRKVEPLRRRLASGDAWLTGLRRDQAVTRAALAVVEWDTDSGGLVKVNPLAAWSHEHVWTWIHEHDVPHNRLHDAGYASIGCVPCTRPISPGDDVRAGRWWWEDPGSRECGLHMDPSGRLVRKR